MSPRTTTATFRSSPWTNWCAVATPAGISAISTSRVSSHVVLILSNKNSIGSEHGLVAVTRQCAHPFAPGGVRPDHQRGSVPRVGHESECADYPYRHRGATVYGFCEITRTTRARLDSSRPEPIRRLRRCP